MSKWMLLIRTALVSSLAVSATAPTSTEASPSRDAFDAASQKNTLRAMEQFVEQFPNSPEAKLAMREILSLSRRGELSTKGLSGLTASTGLNVVAANRNELVLINPYR